MPLLRYHPDTSSEEVVPEAPFQLNPESPFQLNPELDLSLK